MSISEEAVEVARRAIEREFPYDENNEYIVQLVLEAAASHLTAPVLALADKWQEDFPDKARQLREAIGDNS